MCQTRLHIGLCYVWTENIVQQPHHQRKRVSLWLKGFPMEVPFAKCKWALPFQHVQKWNYRPAKLQKTLITCTWYWSTHSRYLAESMEPSLNWATPSTAAANSLARVTLISFSTRVNHSLILGCSIRDTGVLNRTCWRREQKSICQTGESQ